MEAWRNGRLGDPDGREVRFAELSLRATSLHPATLPPFYSSIPPLFHPSVLPSTHPSFHYSNIPFFHPPILPSFHHSIIPFLPPEANV